jgi:hypothetical protein
LNLAEKQVQVLVHQDKEQAATRKTTQDDKIKDCLAHDLSSESSQPMSGTSDQSGSFDDSDDHAGSVSDRDLDDNTEPEENYDEMDTD